MGFSRLRDVPFLRVSFASAPRLPTGSKRFAPVPVINCSDHNVCT